VVTIAASTSVAGRGATQRFGTASAAAMPTAKPASSSADAASVNVIRPSPENSSRSAASVPTATPATSRAPAESAKPTASARPAEGATP
jgi:hypothetical protein